MFLIWRNEWNHLMEEFSNLRKWRKNKQIQSYKWLKWGNELIIKHPVCISYKFKGVICNSIILKMINLLNIFCHLAEQFFFWIFTL